MNVIKTFEKEHTPGVEVQELSGEESPSQPAPDRQEIKNLIEGLRHGRLLVSDLKSKGVLFAVVPGFNRKTNTSHVKALIESRKKIGKFLEPIRVISAVEYFAIYPDRKLIVDGKEICKDSPEVYYTVVTMDGQHRGEAEAALLAGAFTPSLEAEYVNLMGLTPDSWIVEVNTLGRNWTSKDRTGYILSSCSEKESNIFLADKWQREYGMGERAAYAILNLDDGYKRSLQVAYMNDPSNGLPTVLQGTEAKRERGKKILHAFEVGFREVPAMLKNMAAINLAIEKYKSVDDKEQEKEKALKEILLFFTGLDPEVAKKAAQISTVAAKQAILNAEWQRVSKSFKTEAGVLALEEQASLAEEEWKKLKAQPKATTKVSKKTKSKNAATKSAKP